ncbi:MAG: hypothetical protein KKB50_17165 [Planctomycetes bacterium]|nr:hypothetical protein [Planctomycetota bacterium]
MPTATAMDLIQLWRPTALPVLLYLVWLPLFLLLPGQHVRTFFIGTGLATLLIVAGPALALGLVLAILGGFALVEGVVRLGRGRRLAFAVVLVGMHVGYWACFHLPRPEPFEHAALRLEDRPSLMILFCGIALTFLRLVSYFWDRMRQPRVRVALLDYLAYMLFFPQFRHGPLERCQAFATRLRNARANWTTHDFSAGVLRIALGFATLGALAAILTQLAGATQFDPFRQPELVSATRVLLLVHGPPLALYAVESAYASLQLGVARVFGVTGSENYRYPLIARTPREVWHRWNITLFAWLRDYAYRPLRSLPGHRHWGVLVVFVYCGLLHGLQLRCLAWGICTGGTFMLWSGLAGALPRRHSGGRPRRRLPPLLRSVLSWAGTYCWASLSLLILLDPDYCGWRLLLRYFEVLAAPLSRLLS